MQRRLALLFLAVALGLTGYTLVRFWSFEHLPLIEKLQVLWDEDTAQLEASGKLPKAWKSIRDIELYGGTKESKQWLRHLQVPIRVNPQGHYKLELLLVNWTEGPKIGTMIQYDLVDLKTKNTIWELGRTYILRDTSSWRYQLVKPRQ